MMRATKPSISLGVQLRYGGTSRQYAESVKPLPARLVTYPLSFSKIRKLILDIRSLINVEKVLSIFNFHQVRNKENYN